MKNTFASYIVRLLCAVCISSVFFTTVCTAADSANNRKNVLYLNSYHLGYSWSDGILEGIKKTLEASEFSVVLQVEYMDSKKFHYEETVQTLKTLYREKFRGKQFDAIIVSDNIAFDFIRKFGEELFPGVPVVFCGINDFDASRIDRNRAAGVVESFDVAANLNLALRLHANMKRMVIIGDRSVTGLAIRNQVMKVMPQFKDTLEVEFWSDYKLDQMLEWVRNAGKDTFFYFIPMYLDIDGQFFSAQELLRRVRAQTNAPLYSNWAFLLGDGILGGKLLDGERHGEAAAKVTLEVLAGKPTRDIPIVHTNDEPWLFDYKELKRLHISERWLPDGSTVINAPSRFYELNKQVFWTIIVSLVVLTIILLLLVMNVIEKRSVEQRIKDQLSFLRLLMDTIPIPIYSKDKYGRYQECNEAFERFFNVKRDEVLNRNEWQLQGRGLAQLHDALDNKLLRQPGIEIYEQTITGPDDVPHNMILHKATNMSARGSIAGLVGVLFDYTDRKQAEDSLRAAEEKYRSIFENSPLGIFRLKPQGEFVDGNPSLARMLGFLSREDMLENGPEHMNRLLSEVDLEAVPAEEVVAFERGFSLPDRSKVTANITIRIIRDRLGNIELLEGFAENVTKRKQAEKALRDSEHMLQLVLDNIPQLVSWKDRDLIYMGANLSFEAFFGVTHVDNVIGLTDFDIMPEPNDADIVRNDDAQVIVEGRPRYQERLSIAGPEGDLVWLETNRVPLHDENGTVVGILTTAEDVTQRINLERQLLQSQKMEAIGTLAGGISHDFNNILTSIINSVELAITDIDEDSLTWTDMSRALKAAQRGSQLVKQILTFSRPSVEGFMTTNISEVLSEALGLIKASLPRNIEIRESLPDTPSVTKADPTQIHQVVMNLCTNAFQALRDTGGILEVRLDLVRLETEDAQMINVHPGNYFMITVADNGPGIGPEILDKIFDPFFTTKGKTEGTGLGLAVVHGIIKAHGGGIRVSSLPQQRTAFEIYLPSMTQITDEIEDILPLEDEAGEEYILFVEDDEDQLQTIPRVLEGLGYSVLPVGSPKEAIEIVRKDHGVWDLVITDFDMPDIDGLELARTLETIAPDLPVLIVSGRDVASRGASSIPNIKAVLDKPYNRNTLSETIRKVLH